MGSTESSAITKAKRALNKKMSSLVFLVFIGMGVSGFTVWKFAENERARDLYNWQVRIGLVADRKEAEISGWVESQFSDLTKLAENQSLQLYMTELEIIGKEGLGLIIEEEPAETTFLRNLITVTAKRGGFLAPNPVESIRANINNQGNSGIALVNNEGKVVVSTQGMPILEDRLLDFVENLPRGKRVLLDIYKNEDGDPAMGFAVPVYSIQGDREADQQIGVVLGVKPIDKELFPIIETSYPGYKTPETVLLRSLDSSVEYLSPLADGKPAMFLKMARNTPNLAASAAIDEPGAFLQNNDYGFKKTLGTGRKITGTSWSILHKIDYEEAMRDSNARLQRLVGVFILAVLVVFVGVLAAWRHGSSLKSEKVALRYKNLYNRFKGQEHLLRLVSDNQPDSMFLVDHDSKYCYANFQAASDAGVVGHDVVGKPMLNVLGAGKSQIYQSFNNKALSMSATVSHVQSFKDKVLQIKHIPVHNIPNIIADDETNGVLVIEQDITALVEEREKQEEILEQLINSLVSLVDRHDPYAADHSSRVSKLAKAIAEEIGLDEILIETAQVAGRLMNVGKILLPAELLTKKDDLNEDEKKDIIESIYESAAFLRDISFEGPVVETLDQCLEHWDGSGPKGMKGKDILVTARIVSVANAFVAMLSPRAYREKIDQSAALDILLKDVDKQFQRSIVAALINYVENHDGQIDFHDE